MVLDSVLGPVFDSLGLHTLTYHWHVLLLSTLACRFIVTASSVICPVLFPKTYPNLAGSKRLNWDIHVVSMVHSLVIIVGSALVLTDNELMKDKVFGYDRKAGNVYAIACGYFLWDTCTSIKHANEFGHSFVFHGLSSFTVFIFSFRPFLNYYGAVFLMYELSTPFLNIHWFMDKSGMTGSKLQLANGICLLLAFFSARLVFGYYMSYQTYVSVIAQIDKVPTFLCILYGTANIILNGLNVIWFSKMISSLIKRFQSPKKVE